MAVSSQHPAYRAAAPKWRRMRDAISGVDAVKAAGEIYLPRLGGQSDEEYAAYVKRANWFGGTARTVDALHGLIFRKPAVVKGPKSLIDDFTMTGQSAGEVASAMTREVLSVSRTGLMVDFVKPPEGKQPSNAAQAEKMGLRAFASRYSAESIINWRPERVNGVMQLVLVVLAEPFETIGSDGFEVGYDTQYRVLRLVNGTYVQQVYRDSGSGLAVVEEHVPLMRNKPLPFIPFWIVGSETIGPDVDDPLLIDLADINLSHYRTSADLEHGAHFTGLPTAVVSGYQPETEGEKLAIGSSTAWVLRDPGAKAEFLEFKGDGLGSLEKLLDRKELQMAQLGARMLTEHKSQVESAKALEIRSSGEYSILGSIAALVGRAVTSALAVAAEWMGSTEEVRCSLNTDFAVASMEPQKILALVSAWQSGAISHKTLFWNLKQGETVAEDVEFEDEEAAIANEGPNLAAGAKALIGQRLQGDPAAANDPALSTKKQG